MRMRSRTALSVLAALALAAASLLGGTVAVAAATPPAAPEITVTCAAPADDGVAVCSVSSTSSFSGDDQVQFSATLPGVGSFAGTTGT